MIGIEDWHIDVEFIPDAKFAEVYGANKAGFCDAVPTRRWATVAVNLSPGDKTDPEHSLIHEECHILSNDVWMAILRMMDTFITDAHTREYVKDEVGAKVETMVDKMASAMLRLKAMGERKKAGVAK
jgi:hypothetical protein